MVAIQAQVGMPVASLTNRSRLTWKCFASNLVDSVYLAAVQLFDLHMLDENASQGDTSIEVSRPYFSRKYNSLMHLRLYQTLPISRSRRIGTTRSNAPAETISLALNGRKGRRFACVGMPHSTTSVPGDEEGTKSVGVFDMDENEGADEEDGEEASGEQQGAEGSEYEMEVD